MLQQTWYTLGRSAIGAYAQTMLDVDISRHAPLPKGAKIIAANHPTTTDPILIELLTFEPMHILITEMCFAIPVIGKSLRLAGHIPVVTGNGRAALDEAVQLLQAGRTVGIFPEGALSPLDGGLEKPHTGVARLALISGAPVIPVGIHLQRGHIRFDKTTVDDMTETARWYLHGPYAMTVGEPMHFEGSVEDRRCVRTVSERIMQRIARLSRESAQRICAQQASQPGNWLRVRPARAD